SSSKESVILLSLLYVNLTSGSSTAAPGPEKRCLCIQKVSWMVPPRQISKVTIYPESPQCAVPEVIATLKSGREICLDPTAAWVRKVMATRKKLSHISPILQL
uniref:C-X-C motif chemokine n=1 Tax=Varanus komodoensis TaxID=61221 RepID=A0A8D2KSX9_VARKO